MSDDNSVMTAERLAREVAAEMREKHPGWAVSVDGSTVTFDPRQVDGCGVTFKIPDSLRDRSQQVAVGGWWR